MFCDDTYRVVLFGHRDFYGHRTLDERLYPLLKDLIRTKPFVEIYIGRNGEFDIYAATVVKRVQNAMGKANNEFICVLPYPEKDMEYYEEYYDNVMIPECIGHTHPKGGYHEAQPLDGGASRPLYLLRGARGRRRIYRAEICEKA